MLENELRDQWIHVKVEVDETENTYDYEVTDQDGTVLASAEDVSFVDDTIDAVTQIELFGYCNNGYSMIDNLSITVEK